MTKKAWLFLLLSLSGISFQTIKSQDLPAHVARDYQLVWQDEFEGKRLNSDIWNHRGLETQRKMGIVKEANSFLDGQGNCVIQLTKVGEEYHIGQISTMLSYSTCYGYFECRARMNHEPGPHIAFWLQSPKMSTGGDPATAGAEIDIFEFIMPTPNRIYHTVHYGGYAPDKHQQVGGTVDIEGIREGFHSFGLEWLEDEYIFYVDGKESWRTREAVSKIPQYLILSLECTGWGGDPGKAQLPDEVVFDYVRVYKKKTPESAAQELDYQGKWVEGSGDAKTLKLIDQAFKSLHISPDMATVPMLYKRDWDGFVEGHYWAGWWLQNSFGPTFGMLPFWTEEPYKTWIRHSQGLWFNNMGNDERQGSNGYIAPDGSLMDCVILYMNGRKEDGFRSRHSQSTDSVFNGTLELEEPIFRQGDGNTLEYDWYYGGALAGIILESERLLVSQNPSEIKARLPQLKRIAAFVDERRDPKANLIRGGRSSNLLAPSFGGVKQADGSYATAYLTELSVNYCAGLDRLIRLCEIIGDQQSANTYRKTLKLVKTALSGLLEEPGYFIRYLDDEGNRHGVFGAEKFGYLEATPNHDAVAMGVTNDQESQVMINQLLSVPNLYPHDLILPNYPAYDDLDNITVTKHLPPGMWVDGGFWATTQARMSMACLRVNEFEHPFKAWEKQLAFMQGFRADAPMKDYGLRPWDDKVQGWGSNVVYDCWGVPGGLLRGLFEYTYLPGQLRIRPHLPPDISRYVQKHPVLFGTSKVYITVTGTGKARLAKANGIPCEVNQEGWIMLEKAADEKLICLEIVCGTAAEAGAWKPIGKEELLLPNDLDFLEVNGFVSSLHPHIQPQTVHRFYQALKKAGLEESYEGAMSRLVLEHLLARKERQDLLLKGQLLVPDLPGTPKADEADISSRFVKQARYLTGGLVDHLTGMSYWKDSVDPKIYQIAKETGLVLEKK